MQEIQEQQYFEDMQYSSGEDEYWIENDEDFNTNQWTQARGFGADYEARALQLRSRAEVVELFKQLDTNGNGYLDLAEFEQVLIDEFQYEPADAHHNARELTDWVGGQVTADNFWKVRRRTPSPRYWQMRGHRARPAARFGSTCSTTRW